jgi:F-type H+-transporting ATPase subunit b
MNEFLDQFGIDWKLLLSQLVNFSLILIILRAFVYKPLLRVLKERKEKIEEGLAKAEESDVRLKEVDQIAKQKIKETDEKCIVLLAQTDVRKKELETDLALKIKKKEEDLLKKTEVMAEGQKKEMYAKLQKEAGEVIRSAIAKAIEVEPEQVDEKLIKKTASILEAH